MEPSRLVLTIFVIVCSLQKVAESATATTATVPLKKSAGQLLDETFSLLRKDFKSLNNVDDDLTKKVERLSEDIETLKLIHGKCAPCQPVHGTDRYCDCTNYPPKRDCLEFHQAGFKVDGLYKISGPRFSSITAYCDQKTMDGGWTVIQRRQDGTVDFQRNWHDYSNGFGHQETEFWFGNENIHDLTKRSEAPKNSTLLINMKIKGKTVPVYAKYSSFNIGDAASKYVLHISGFSGNVGSTNMAYHNKMKFTTFDQDNDRHVGNCASICNGGWWYGGCFYVHLNGPYYNIPGFRYNMTWNHYAKPRVYPSFVEMKIKRNL